jgi:hypothetical protein
MRLPLVYCIIRRPSKKYKPHGAYYPQLPFVLLSRVTALIILCSSGESGFYVARKYVSSIILFRFHKVLTFI